MTNLGRNMDNADRNLRMAREAFDEGEMELAVIRAQSAILYGEMTGLLDVVKRATMLIEETGIEGAL